jgi:hypothetical protein
MLAGSFPSLLQSTVWVTAPSTSVYNCIAWSIGLDDRWINPLSPLSAFQAQYQTWGQKGTTLLSSSADVDGWGTSTTDTTHGSKTYKGVYLASSLWESKLGASLRITHDRQGLQGSTYGSVIASFSPGYAFVGMELRTMDAGDDFRADHLAVVTEAIQRISPDLRSRFEAAYAAWEATWFQGKLAFTNDTHDFAQGEAFNAVKALGAPILPLVVEKLLDRNNFVALLLYDVLQPATELVIHYAEGDPNQIEGEQGRARRTVHRWLAAQAK